MLHHQYLFNLNFFLDKKMLICILKIEKKSLKRGHIMKNVIKLYRIYRSIALIAMICSIRPALCENNFLSYISNVFNPKVFFKPSIDAITIFFKPERLKDYATNSPHEL